MRYILILFLFTLSVSTALLTPGCNTKPPAPDNIFSYRDPIVNPPDEFKISFDISQVGDKIATVTFADSAVWLIANQGDSRVTFYIQNAEGEKLGINNSEKLGLRGGISYMLVANNNNHTELRDFFCKLTKQTDDYTGFEPKF